MSSANMFSTAFYPDSFQQPPTYGGGFHHSPRPSHLPHRGPPYGRPGCPDFDFVYGFFTPPPAFGMHPPPWASPHPPPFFYGPPGFGFCEHQSYSPHCGFHNMRPSPFPPTQRCSFFMAHNNLSEQPGESYGPHYPVGDGAEFPSPPPAPQTCGESFPPLPGDGEQSLPVRFARDHEHDRHDGEMNKPGRNDESQEQDPRPTSPAHHGRLRSGHGKRHAHGPPPPGAFHGPHAIGRHPPPPHSGPHFPDRRRHDGSYPFEGFEHHAPPMPPPPPFCGQSHGPPCSCMQLGFPGPSCVGPPHAPPTGHFGRPNRGHPRRGTSIGRGHFDHRHRGGWGRHWHGPPPESGSDTDPNNEGHNDEAEPPVDEANQAHSGQKAGREDEWEGVEHDERAPDVVSEVTVRDGEDGGNRENETKDT